MFLKFAEPYAVSDRTAYETQQKKTR